MSIADKSVLMKALESKLGEALTVVQLTQVLRTVGEELTNVHPHRFRRTLATGLIDSGMPIQDVAAILGHEKLDTTMKYVYLSNENIRSAYQRYMK